MSFKKLVHQNSPCPGGAKKSRANTHRKNKLLKISGAVFKNLHL